MKPENYKEVESVDLDGTLAEYHGFKGDDVIGKPVPAMLERVKGWLKAGKRVVIFTARANNPDSIPPIREWLKKHVGQALPVTAKKLPTFKRIWDDRAVSVEKNTGKILTKGVKSKAMGMALNP